VEAGGRTNAKILYIPTNAGTDFSTPDRRERELQEFLTTAQFGQLTFPVELLHTYSRTEANRPEFYSAIDEATAVYFRGGLPFWSYDAYKDTQTETALRRLLERGGVIGGSSAGALMQSNIMLRGDRSQSNHIVLGNPWIGFSFGDMENIIFDVHNLQRNRAHDLIEVLDVFPQHLGINIDEDTAVVMKGDIFETIGTGWVQIFDPTLWQAPDATPFCANFLFSTGSGRCHVSNGGKSHFMWAQRRATAGDRYNVRTREVLSALTEEDIKALMTEQEI
jgi:cyanophycinase